MNHTLHLQYDASLQDFEAIQLYLLFIGNQWIFLTTYIISIFAAVYGVTKFFMLSRASPIKDADTDDKILFFLLMFTVNSIYIVGKGAALAAFVLVWENEMYLNVLWWFLFCMLPSILFALFVIFGSTCYETTFTMCGRFSVYSNYSISLLLEEPPILIVPVVTPFVFRTKIEYETAEIDDEKMDGTISSVIGSKYYLKNKPEIEVARPQFKLRPIFCLINHIITVSCSAAGLIVKAQQPIEIVLPVALLIIVVTVFPVCCFYFTKSDKDELK